MLDLPHLADLLDRHDPFDALEAENITRTRSFLANIDRATGRGEDAIHAGRLTAAGWVIDPHAKKLLIVRNDRLGLWLNPGGKYEPEDGTVIETMRREVRQESGVWINPGRVRLFDVSVIGQDFNPRLPCTFYDLRFLATATARPRRPAEADKQPRWVTLDEAMQLMPDNIQNYRLYRRTERIFGL